ncbi:hypothetical protein NKR23_g1780 [Pleurostoma richardsiae]|uniref:Coenzyme Q-binding protein COQ10 START domain-containing protein n=1 Tax=Pleurostoma richardsiae TaxID=41990 RepID=A0AA38SB77_9PEZI|nr:hypothetical protein NKR23_g1780 [Pleurostoma richardsiae]
MAAVTSSTPPVPRSQRGTLSGPVIPTPTHGASGGSFTVTCSTRIAAPPDAVLGVLLDTATYPAWNRFVRQVDVVSHPEPPSPAAAADDTAAPTALPAGEAGGGSIGVGTAMIFSVYMDLASDKPSNRAGVEVTRLEPFTLASPPSAPAEERNGWRVAWRATDLPGWLLRTERVQEVVDDGAGGTEYTCWETFYGVLALVVKLKVGGRLVKGFDAWMDGLKARAEELAGE